MKLRLGISTCPNDSFSFHPILAGEIDTGPFQLDIAHLDIEELNEAFGAGRLHVAKVSAAALLDCEGAELLDAGAALGFGVGPVLLARPGFTGKLRDARCLCPGAHTTASLLYRLLHPAAAHPRQVRFSEILPALAAGDADVGVCIHEGRFTYAEHGLTLLEDLGRSWEERTGHPVLLGGIAARLDLGAECIAQLTSIVRKSVEHARAHRAECLATMRRHAQEQSDEVLWRHVELYVNEWTVSLGRTGRAALGALRDAWRDSRA